MQVLDSAVDNLWSQQADVLRTYARDHQSTPDVALELPTGSGKTLIGLLVAEWRRLRLRERVAFVCPTNQLARQVHEKAAGYGIDTVLLIGPSDDWPPADSLRFTRSEAVAVTNYNHVFNRTPRIQPQVLVMDDAHTAEGPVADRWSLRLDRNDAREAYFAALTAVAQELTEHHRRGLLNNDLDPARQSAIEVLLPHAVHRVSEALTAAISEHVEGRQEWYAWDAIGASLDTCLVFASWRELLIRPFIAPTFTQDAFVAATQRVYLSATLGSGGELERSFGRSKISRIPQPADWDTEGSGRRYVLAPGAGRDGTEANQLISEIVSKVGRVLLLAPSERHLNRVSSILLPKDFTELRRSDIEHNLDAFTTAERAALLLANRYDGIDLPHDACRLIVLSGLPSGTHLQERFLFDELGAPQVLSERIRTRITQGAGRATRGRRDTAVVILHGDGLINFLSQGEIVQVLRSELQAEFDLALTNADLPAEEMLESIQSFLAQDDDWKPTEAWLRSTAQERPRQPAPGATQLANAAEHEIAAWDQAWRGDYNSAVAAAQRAAAALNNPATASYRAWWCALAASWSILDRGEEDGQSRELVRQSGFAAAKLRWRPPLPSAPPAISPEEALVLRAKAAVAWLRRRVRGPRLERDLVGLENDLAESDATRFELGLELLGEILGFDSERPAKQKTAPDGAWRDGGSAWLVFEAKTEEQPDGTLSAEEIRQANSHVNWIQSHFAWSDPERAVTVIVTEKPKLHEDAVGIANETLYLVRPITIREIGAQAIAAQRELASEIIGLTDQEASEHLAARFASSRLSTLDLITRLTQHPLA